MKVLFKLLNRSSEFVAGCFFDFSSFSPTKDRLDTYFGQIMLEYNWEEEQSFDNALLIFEDLLYFFYKLDRKTTEQPGLVTKFNNVYSNFAKEKVKNNIFMSLDFGESSSIFFDKRMTDAIEEPLMIEIERSVPEEL